MRLVDEPDIYGTARADKDDGSRRAPTCGVEDIKIAGGYSRPFRPETEAERVATARAVLRKTAVCM